MSCNTNDGNKKNDNSNKNNELKYDTSSCEINFDNILFDFPKKARDVLLDDTEKQLVDLAASTVSQWKLLWNKQ
jgi:hypothetical protein